MDKFDLLMMAVIAVESGGDPHAVGDGGRAVGILQIHPIMVRECNRIIGRAEWQLSDRRNPAQSKRMFRTYMGRYGRGKNLEVMACRWNGGPRGERNPATKKYWLKVKRELDNK